MDAIGIIPRLTGSAQLLPASPSQGGAPSLPLPSSSSADLPIGGTDTPEQVDFSAQAAEQRRAQAVQRAAQDIANIYVISDKRFTIFKDMSGQYITRFTSLRDGRVTYIPEPDLLRMSSPSAGVAPLLTIKA